jgi:F-type H+-transporting ATPase subunit gamma
MANAREVKQRIKSVKNISQVTRALQAVSASKVRKAIAQLEKTRPYAQKSWQVLQHIAEQPGREYLHPLLIEREEIGKILVIVISGDRGLAGAYNTNLIRTVQEEFDQPGREVDYVTVGRKGRDLLLRRGKNIIAEFSDLPAELVYGDISVVGQIAVEEFLSCKVDEVYLVYTRFVNRMNQRPIVKMLLPLEPEKDIRVKSFNEEDALRLVTGSYTYEPDRAVILDQTIPRFVKLQVYHAVLEALASEHAARMVAMKSATDNATELADALQLEYNKARQQAITNEMLDIAGAAEAVTGS